MKKLLYGLAILGSIYVGEKISPYQNVRDAIRFHNTPVGEGFAHDPWNYSLHRVIEEEDGVTSQSLYLVNESKGLVKKVDDDGCTCSLGNSIDEFMNGSKEWVKEKIEKLKD